MAKASLDRVSTRIRSKCGVAICLLAFLLPVSPVLADPGPGTPLTRWGKITTGSLPDRLPIGQLSVQKLADNVFWFRSPRYENTLIIVGSKGVLITDTYNDAHAVLLKQEIAKITDKPVTKIVLSHEHFDHIGGTGQFPGAKIIAQQSLVPLLAFDPLHRAPAKIDETFDKDLSIDMGTTTVELKYWGQTEGVANTVVRLPKEKIALFSDLHPGDRSLIDMLSLSVTNMVGLRHVLNEVSKWDLTYALDSHTANTDIAMVREYAGFMNDLYDAVLPLVKKQNETVDALELYYQLQFVLPDSVKLPKYKNWRNYNEELPANVMWMASSILYNGL